MPSPRICQQPPLLRLAAAAPCRPSPGLARLRSRRDNAESTFWEAHTLRNLPVLCALFLPAVALAYQPLFLARSDGSLEATPGGQPIATKGQITFAPGKVGQAASFPPGALATYAAKGVLDKAHGTVCLWVRPNWNGDDGQSHHFVAEVSDFNNRAQNTLAL